MSPMVKNFEIAKVLVKTPEEITKPEMTNNAEEYSASAL